MDSALLDNLKQSVGRPHSAAAKYLRLEEALSELIADERLRPGMQLPADKLFAEQIGLSLGTVQKALGNLHKRGLLDRAPRRGTSIAHRQVESSDIFTFRFRDPDTGKLIPPRVRTIGVTKVTKNGLWTDFLGSQQLVCVERLLQVGVEPPVYSQVYLPDDRGTSLLDQNPDDLDGFSIHRHMDQRYGAPTLRSENKVYLGHFSARAAQLLTLANGSPALTWDISSYTVGDRPAVFQRIQMPPNHRPLEFRRTHAD